MNAPRFFAAVGARQLPDSSALTEALRRRNFEPLQAGRRTSVWQLQSGNALCCADRFASVLGRPYHRSDAAPQSRPWECGDFDRTDQSIGRQLSERGWGEWVSISEQNDGRVEVARSPTVTSGCYYASTATCLWVTSDAELLWELGLVEGAVNWSELGRFLLFPSVRPAQTCIDKVSELLPGEAIYDVEGVRERGLVWSPWTFARRSPELEDHAGRLRRVVISSVATLMSDDTHSVLSVSGGLDSSIVAVASATSGLRPHYITLATSALLGDERAFARMLAARTGAQLREERERLDLIDLATSYASHLPRPTARAFSQSIDRTIFYFARQIGASAYFHGGGGDNVFCMLNSVLPAVDRLRAQGLSAGTFATIADVAALAQHSWIDTGWRTLQRSLSRSRGYRLRSHPLFLHPDVLAASAVPAHPWLDAPRGALPGKAMHIAWVLGIQNFLEGHAHEREIAWHAPLLTQPVVETCLAIPSWAWCEGGRNRSVARGAFADLLPAEILHRQSKGSPTSLLYELIEQRAEQVRAMLFEGILAKSGLLDVQAMAAVFSNRARIRSADLIRLMQFVDVEAWLQSRAGRVGR